MNEKQKIKIVVALTEFEIDVVTDYANEKNQGLEEFLACAAEESARSIAYAEEWSEMTFTQEEIEEFTNDYHNDRLIDFLRDAKRYE